MGKGNELSKADGDMGLLELKMRMPTILLASIKNNNFSNNKTRRIEK